MEVKTKTEDRTRTCVALTASDSSATITIRSNNLPKWAPRLFAFQDLAAATSAVVLAVLIVAGARLAALPPVARVARTASTPRAVRIRRERNRPKAPIPSADDATPTGLTPTEHARYQRLLAMGELADESGKMPTEGEWLERLDERRSRIRGVRTVKTEDGTEEQVVGHTIYLPNIIFKLVRNHTPPGQPYNPYEATFRVPPSITKTDIRGYLAAVYGVRTTYVRTDNYISPLFSLRTGPGKVQRSERTYKRAVVGLAEPFYYPQALEDMSAADREKRLAWINQVFGREGHDDLQHLAFLSATKRSTPQQSWRWRTGATAQRGNIMRLIAERRANREEVIKEAKEQMVKERGTAGEQTASS
ncbi:hypothetical protein CERSUDRAFT_92772 [Gelatoporia subvermispora B]|uniref:Large ribosomal subunit protein uL23m n=1 Tax=Ceriporiopsis subvermispora (strain B) TaxID=914234 RepID=M2R2G9_CERS8|nr:hypothetical protein CERSUDRAFT_92772 [Gelatoporia subvermispora B]